MAKKLSLTISRLVMGTAVAAALTGIASLVIGLLIMYTYSAMSLRTSAGIWSGALMILHVVVGVLVLVTRHIGFGTLYFVINLVCVPLTMFGAIIAHGYKDSFVLFGDYNDNGLCSVQQKMCLCADQTGQFVFERDFAITNCSDFGLGGSLWLVVFILCLVNAVLSLIGLWCAMISIILFVRPKAFAQEEEDDEHEIVDGEDEVDAVEATARKVTAKTRMMRVM